MFCLRAPINRYYFSNCTHYKVKNYNSNTQSTSLQKVSYQFMPIKNESNINSGEEWENVLCVNLWVGACPSLIPAALQCKLKGASRPPFNNLLSIWSMLVEMVSLIWWVSHFSAALYLKCCSPLLRWTVTQALLSFLLQTISSKLAHCTSPMCHTLRTA